MKELIIKKCMTCGATINVIEDCTCDNCSITCCGNAMNTLKANSVDASFEKHVPNFKRENGKLLVEVNHVMDDDHYIEWICLITDEKEEFRYFKPGESATCEFDDTKGATLYSYCNKHLLWKKEI